MEATSYSGYLKYLERLKRVRPDDGKPEPVSGNIFHEPDIETYQEIYDERKLRIEASQTEPSLSDDELEELRNRLF